MSEGLSMEQLPQFTFSAFRYFDENEHHITRFCPEDVLLLVFDGVLRFSENGRPVEVKKGEYYIQKHGLRQEGPTPSLLPKYYYIHFHGDFTSTGKRLPLRGTVDISALYPLFQRLELLRMSRASRIEITAVFCQILTELFVGQQNAQGSQVVRSMMESMVEHIREPLSLSQIADSLGYCKNHLINLFRRETGQTPHAYLIGLRLEQAKQLLLNSSLTLAQISQECGFESYVNFYKAFVKAEGKAPLEWKKERTG